MLTPEELHDVEAELGRYPVRRAGAVEALMVLQRHRGWISDEALKDLAGHLEMTPEELDALATFYSLIFRKPVGRKVILLCDSVSCWIMGVEDISTAIASHLGIVPGGTTPDGAFTLLPTACLGACDHAPVLMVGEETYPDVRPESVGPILDQEKEKSGGPWRPL